MYELILLNFVKFWFQSTGVVLTSYSYIEIENRVSYNTHVSVFILAIQDVLAILFSGSQSVTRLMISLTLYCTCLLLLSMLIVDSNSKNG